MQKWRMGKMVVVVGVGEGGKLILGGLELGCMGRDRLIK